MGRKSWWGGGGGGGTSVRRRPTLAYSGWVLEDKPDMRHSQMPRHFEASLVS